MAKKPVTQPTVTQQIHPTREAWLEAATSELSVYFLTESQPLPQLVKLTCGFTSGGTRNRGGASQIGECWDASRSGMGAVEIMISPVKDNPYEVLATLSHELCHAAAGIPAGHKGMFAKLARGLHLEGPLTATYGGDQFRLLADPILKRLGAYPHAKLDTSKRVKQGTRLIKCWCTTCGYTVRTTQTWLTHGTPLCPTQGHGAMVHA